MQERIEEAIEEAYAHYWTWTEVIAWAAGTAGSVFSLLAERCMELEASLTPPDAK